MERPSGRPASTSVSYTHLDVYKRQLKGFFWALGAYLFWGVLPLYMKLVAHLPTIEVLAHRVIWSVPIALALLLLLGRTADIPRALRSPRTMLQAAVAAAEAADLSLIHI